MVVIKPDGENWKSKFIFLLCIKGVDVPHIFLWGIFFFYEKNLVIRFFYEFIFDSFYGCSLCLASGR